MNALTGTAPALVLLGTLLAIVAVSVAGAAVCDFGTQRGWWPEGMDE